MVILGEFLYKICCKSPFRKFISLEKYQNAHSTECLTYDSGETLKILKFLPDLISL